MKRRQPQISTAGDCEDVRAAPYCGTWTCTGGLSTNVLYANRPLSVNHALMLRVQCASCPPVFRLRLLKTFGQA